MTHRNSKILDSQSQNYITGPLPSQSSPCTTQKEASHLHPVCVVVQQQDARAGHLLRFHHGLQISQQAHVFGHVSSQHLGSRQSQLWYRGRWQETPAGGRAAPTMSITILRSVCLCFLLRFWKMSQLSSCSSLKPTARWWFSSTDSSLYISASSESKPERIQRGTWGWAWAWWIQVTQLWLLLSPNTRQGGSPAGTSQYL